MIHCNNLSRPLPGIGDDRDLRVNALEEKTHERGHVRADLAGADGEAGVVQNAELEQGERHPVRLASAVTVALQDIRVASRPRAKRQGFQ